MQDYITYLKKDIDYDLELHRDSFESRLDTLYFGGGTPSLLETLELKSIVDSISDKIKIDESTEFTVEMDPGTFDRQKLNDFHALGVNRISMGV